MAKPVLAPGWAAASSRRHPIAQRGRYSTYNTPKRRFGRSCTWFPTRGTWKSCTRRPKDIPLGFILDRQRARVFDTILNRRVRSFGKCLQGVPRAYEIPVTKPQAARTANEAWESRAASLPVVLKIHSPQIHATRRRGGVVLNLGTAEKFGRLSSNYQPRQGKTARRRIIGVTVAENVTYRTARVDHGTKKTRFRRVIMVGMGGVGPKCSVIGRSGCRR